jgi:RNA polymerase sigma factor (sigma-70 family)
MPLPSAEFLRTLCRLAAVPRDGTPGDRDLLRRFVETRGEAAFAAIVARHGPLVWQVCRRLLCHEQDAEDAFQATFLVLARQAARVRKQASLKSWLYGIATRVALSLRRSAARRRAREQRATVRAPDGPARAAALAELQAILAEEVGRLPEHLRAPLVLCCVEGQSKPEAARQLGWPEGTVASRLARARATLRARLARRGVALGTAFAAAGLSSAAQAIPVRLALAAAQVVSRPATASAAVALAARAAQTAPVVGSPLRCLAAVLALALVAAAGWSYWDVGQLPDPHEAAQPAAVGPRDAAAGALPPGVAARLGTDQLRALADSVQFGADGKTLVGVDGTLVRTWDAADGKLLSARQLPVKGDRRWGPWFRSRDGNTWLLRGEPGVIEIWDVPSGRRVDLPVPTDCKRVDRFAISNDRRLLVVCDTRREESFAPAPAVGSSLRASIQHEQTLSIWDTAARKKLVLAEGYSGTVAVAIAPDGKRAAASGSKGTQVWDVATGKLLWHEPKFNAEEMRFTSDSQTLIAAPGGGQRQWRLWDAATGKAAAGLAAPEVGYVWTFTLSADDRLVAVPTETDYVVWDLEAGKVTHRWPCANQAGKILFAPDGRSVVLHAATLQRFDLATGKRLYADVGALGHTGPVHRLAFTPDGSRLVSMGADETLRIWDPRSARLLHTLALPPAEFDALALTPDGKALLAVTDKLALHRWSLTDARPLPTLQLHEALALKLRLRVREMHVSADSKRLAVVAYTPDGQYEHRKYSFSSWDAGTGRLLAWGADPGKNFNGERARLAPDGRTAAWYAELYATTAPERRRLEGYRDDLRADARITFSSDSRYVAGELKVSRPADDIPVPTGLCLWETATRALVKELPADDSGYGIFLSPDGRWLAQIGVDAFAVHDLRSGKLAVRQSRPAAFGHRRGNWFSTGMAFAPDGRTAVTAHTDGNMLVWSLPATLAASDRPPLTETDAQASWQSLAGKPKEAYAAHWRLRDDPAAAIKLLRARLAPAQGAPEAPVRALIRDLDSDDFDTRSAAMAGLRKVGRPATRTVHNALKAPATLEVRRRLETLLTEWSLPTPRTTDDLRQLRAVTVLEYLGTPEARQLLEELAGGAPEARLTQEAHDAHMRRLRRDPP